MAIKVPGERLTVPEPEIIDSGVGQGGIEYQIIGSTLPALVVELPVGQSIFSESGGMSWMSDNIKMETDMRGGLFRSLMRKLSGESLLVVTFMAADEPGIVGFTAEFPGRIVSLNLGAGQSIICQRDSFMCAEFSVRLDFVFEQGYKAGLLGKGGLVLQRLTGPGLAFVQFNGEIVEYELERDQELMVDLGHLAMYEPEVDFDMEMIGGTYNVIFGGEGLFLGKLKGPGKVWLQTMPAMSMARKIAGYLPRRKLPGVMGM